jgi:hypothetical protein
MELVDAAFPLLKGKLISLIYFWFYSITSLSWIIMFLADA